MGKGLLLAASTRDDELTALAGTRAAHRLPVANRPLLSYGIGAMYAAGVEEVAAVVSPDTSPDVRQLIGDGAEVGPRIGFLEMNGPPSLVHALKASARFLDGAPVMVHLGDALVSRPLPPLFDELERSSADAIVMVRNAAEFSGQGAVPDPGGIVRPLRLVEDKPVPPAEQALAGVFVLGPAAVEAAVALPDHASVHDFMRILAESGGKLETRMVSGSWKYSGAVDGLLEANRMVLDEIETDVTGCDLSEARIEGRVAIHPTAVVERSTIRGPAVIGPRAILQDAFVGPYSSVGAGVRLEGAELEHSIVLDNAVIRHIGRRLEDSLVGSGATVTRDFAFPSGLRLRVGSRAEVLLA